MADDKDFIDALTYLGKGPYAMGLPGGADINVGAGPAPAPGVNVGTFGNQFGPGSAFTSGAGAGGAAGAEGSAEGAAGGSEGANTLGLLQKILGMGAKGADLLSRLGGGDATRGDTGGAPL